MINPTLMVILTQLNSYPNVQTVWPICCRNASDCTNYVFQYSNVNIAINKTFVQAECPERQLTQLRPSKRLAACAVTSKVKL